MNRALGLWLTIGSLVLAGLLQAAQAQQPRLTEWVSSNTTGDPDKIGLGYPVPIPVDTSLPFGGFRSYAGLHARHQDLSMTTPWVHPEDIGRTTLGRTIWAYRLGDEDYTTRYGLPEPATLTNGGIHAREWQSPETVTAILELMATHAEDGYFYDYLRENVNMVVIPSLNIDGFLQTQRYPTLNYLDADPNYPATSPRDGRMRRKNLRDTDEDLDSLTDLLFGVDLNRNNTPFWSTSSNSSNSEESLVYHGRSAASEPEIVALDSAAQLGPAERLRLYTDVHSFSQVHFWSRSSNARLAAQTQSVLGLFSNHHREFEARKWYAFSSARDLPVNRGIGTTAEYFTYNYEVPSWTLEVEPSGGSYHSNLPGCGADYGGDANNCHDGFILPESEIHRVRTELAQSFAAVFYRQAGPPSVQAMRLIDLATGSTVQQSGWDARTQESRQLFNQAVQPLQLGRSYRLWLGFNKPMRWREDGQVTPFPGRAEDTLEFDLMMSANGAELAPEALGQGWIDDGFEAPSGFLSYRDDAWYMDFTLPDTAEHREALTADPNIGLSISTMDMVGLRLDADPATVADWSAGAWVRYESTEGEDEDAGGTDRSLKLPATLEAAGEPFVAGPGISGAWYDLSHNGEGFLVEVLEGGVVVIYWFTYDENGHQDWYLGVGELRGNRVVIPRLLRVSGGIFGEAFDPDLIVETPVGAATFTWSDCGSAEMEWQMGSRSGRQSLQRLTELMGLDCGIPKGAPITESALLSGAWYDPDHEGEGFIVEIMWSGEPVVFWFSYGPDGARRWFFGVGEDLDGTLVFDEMLTTRGGIFGDAFDSELVEETPWGALELELSCEGGTATYSSTEEGFGAGQLQIIRLSQLDGLECRPR